MFGRYRNKRYKNLDGFFVICAAPKETGLPYDVLMDSLGIEKRFPGCPRVGVVVGDLVIPVEISDNPVILSRYDFPKAEEVLCWVFRHRTELFRHWNKELSDREILETVSKK